MNNGTYSCYCSYCYLQMYNNQKSRRQVSISPTMNGLVSTSVDRTSNILQPSRERTSSRPTFLCTSKIFGSHLVYHPSSSAITLGTHDFKLEPISASGRDGRAIYTMQLAPRGAKLLVKTITHDPGVQQGLKSPVPSSP